MKPKYIEILLMLTIFALLIPFGLFLWYVFIGLMVD